MGTRTGPQRGDSPGWRVVFLILQGRDGEWRRAVVFVILLLGFLVALAVVAGPWVPGAITAAGAITGGVSAFRCRRRKDEL
jgi:hypothetical protein